MNAHDFSEEKISIVINKDFWTSYTNRSNVLHLSLLGRTL